MSWIAPGCLLFTGFFTWLLGLASIGLWVGCYFECPTGRDVEFNYYVAVWTGVVAFFTGVFHMFFCCGRRRQFSKVVLWSAAACSFILLPCALLCATLSGYLAWREWDTEQRYQEELEAGERLEEPQGDYVTGIALFATMAVVGTLLLILTLIFNCYHCCGNTHADEEEVEISIEPTTREENPYGRSKSNVPFNQGYYNPPPPQYARESNRGPVYNTKYGNTASSRHDRSYYYGTQDRYDYNSYNLRSQSRPTPASYSHRPGTVTRNYTHDRIRDVRNYSHHSLPTRVRWEEESGHQIPRENPWSFGSREELGPILHQSNYY